jgi:hypothetical protein
MGTKIITFCISCSNLKEEGAFRISLTSGTIPLTITGGICAFFSLLQSVIFLVGFSALVG